MSLEKFAEKHGIKAIYRIIKGDKIILGVLAESPDIDVKGLLKYFSADEAIVIRLDDPSTRFPVLNGTLLVSIDDEFRKDVETQILEKNAERKLEKLVEGEIDELL